MFPTILSTSDDSSVMNWILIMEQCRYSPHANVIYSIPLPIYISALHLLITVHNNIVSPLSLLTNTHIFIPYCYVYLNCHQCTFCNYGSGNINPQCTILTYSIDVKLMYVYNSTVNNFYLSLLWS